MQKRLWKTVFAALLAAALLLSGCENVPEPSDQAGPEQTANADSAVLDNQAASEQRHYKVTEKIIPDPKTSFENNPENQGINYFTYLTDDEFSAGPYTDAKVTLSSGASFCTDGKLYFLYDILYVSDESKDTPYYTGSYCLGILAAPYEKWEYHVFSTAGLTEDPSFSPSVLRIAGVCSNGIFLDLTDNLLAFYSWDDGSLKSLDGIDPNPSGFYQHTLYSAGETLYVIATDNISNGSFTSYDKDLQPVLTQNLENKIYGGICRDSECVWYGFDEGGTLTVWDKPNGTPLYSLGNDVSTYSGFLLTRSDADEFILASISPDLNGIWTGDGSGSLKKALSFSGMGYILQELLTVSSNGDDGFFVTAYFEDKLYLLNFEPTEISDKQEITMVSSDIYPLEQVIAAFNRQSDKYRVNVINPFASGDIEAYCQQLQMEISSGRGPDLMDAWLIDMEGCVKNGYLEPLDDVITDPSDYWPTISDASETDGVLYGISIRFLLSFLSVSKSLAGDLESWDSVQMMEAVQKSPAESLQMGLDSMDIVLRYGLATRDNPQFIDYDAGISHLAEQPFIDFLEFAKNYGDDLYYTDTNYEEAADYYHDGKLAALEIELYSPSDFLNASACFEGQEVLIGMPAAQGRGVYMSLVKVCLNSNSPSKEGAKEFLRYLLSEEGQLLFMQNTMGGFSCRKDMTEQLLNEYQKGKADEGTYSSSKWGIYNEIVPLTDEQLEQLWALLDDAKPEPAVPSEIEDIVREELAPYFAGNCSAEEAAGKLDNRVQIYLDERR